MAPPCDFCGEGVDERSYFIRIEHPAFVCCDMCHPFCASEYTFEEVASLCVAEGLPVVQVDPSHTAIVAQPVVKGTRVVDRPQHISLCELISRVSLQCSLRGVGIDSLFGAIFDALENWDKARGRAHIKNFKALEWVFTKTGIPGKMTGFSYGEKYAIDDDDIMVDIQFVSPNGMKLRSTIIKKIRGPLSIKTYGNTSKECKGPVVLKSDVRARVDAMRRNAAVALKSRCC